jgi:integrase/recombinase XerC
MNLINHKEKHIRILLEKIKEIDIDNYNTVIEYYSIRKEVDKVNTNTINADLIAIYHLVTFIKNKAFIKVYRKEMRAFSNYLKEKGCQDTTISLYLMKIKRFYKFVSDMDKYENGKQDQKDIPYPDAVRWISYNADSDLPLDNILNEKQIKKLLDSCRDIRDQVILVSFLDGGLRKSELINMKVKNVCFDKKLGAYFLLPRKSKGLKTGMRKIQLFLIPSSTIYIRDYLNHHKFKENPEAPFIYTFDSSVKGKKPSDFILTEMGINEIINRIVNDSKINMHITPHMLRHNSATLCCKKGFNEPMLRERYGWSKRSKMPSRYVHLASVDIDDKIKKILGIKDNEKPEESILQPIICWNCEEDNVPTNIFCSRCGVKLNQKQSDKISAKETGLLTQQLLKDKDFMMTMMNKMAEEWEKLQQKQQ